MGVIIHSDARGFYDFSQENRWGRARGDARCSLSDMNFGRSIVTHDLRGQTWLKAHRDAWSCNPTAGQSRDRRGWGAPSNPLFCDQLRSHWHPGWVLAGAGRVQTFRDVQGPKLLIQYMHACVVSCARLCDAVDCRLPAPAVHRDSKARIPEWVAISYSRGSSWPRDRTPPPLSTALAGGFFSTESPGKLADRIRTAGFSEWEETILRDRLVEHFPHKRW